MQKRSSKKTDINQLAKLIVGSATDEAEIVKQALLEGKNPAAVLLGRRGGLVGGKARAKSLSAQKRKKIAKKAAKARWGKQS